MEKRTAHHKLSDIQTKVAVRGIDCFTRSALNGCAAMGLRPAQAMKAIQALTRKHFYKSMTTHADHTVWQDVYHCPTELGVAYVKFTSRQGGKYRYFIQGVAAMTHHYCLQCDDGTELVHKRCDLSAQVKSHKTIVPGVSGWHCAVCGEVEFDPGEGQRYSAAVEVLADAVAAEDAAALRDIRIRLGLTQKAAAELTGGGHNAFSRYERGEARPLPAVMNLFRALDKHPELLAELR